MGHVGNEFEQRVAELRQRQHYQSVWRRQLEPSVKLLKGRLSTPRTAACYSSYYSRSAVLTNGSAEMLFTISGSRGLLSNGPLTSPTLSYHLKRKVSQELGIDWLSL
jgi:hypothetical protein